jgi:hypothetical protein
MEEVKMAKENPWKQINDAFSALCDKKGEPMYKSPISLYETAMQTIMEQRENAIVAKVQDAFDVQVDKDELIRALRDWADQMSMPGRRGLVKQAADRLEELSERVAIMEEIQDGKWTDG